MSDQENQQQAPQKQDKGDSLKPLHVVSSVFAAGLGVQSSKNRERDFKQGRFGVFIAAGIIFTGLFVAAVITVVQLVLKGSGG
ncbi:MAG: DUF2970 domain-containing protein [Gammaproteobacteria bacterium]|nr:MAG: DUF2970 domain-containing protein [Gammaproteobacteria bacterium]RLA60441.1 MAG: DUF2970 domain-containing protein [Gammaproteobacteria bacterium]HDY81768.1 DUF2970 domain-containing protein [Halieaceae bacterium]